MNKFLDWLTTSSANPEKYSMTFKGIMVAFIPLLLLVGQQLHLGWTHGDLTLLIQELTTILSLVLTAFGIARKIVLSFK